MLKYKYKKSTIVLAVIYFSRAQAQVSSTLKSLTSEFGMGSGVTSSLGPPERWRFLYFNYERIFLKPIM